MLADSLHAAQDLPLSDGCIHRYWSTIDEVIREAVVLRGVRVRLLISFWKKTHPLTFNFVTSLKSLCLQLLNCSLEVVRTRNFTFSAFELLN